MFFDNALKKAVVYCRWPNAQVTLHEKIIYQIN
jgi:hypothetical protein